MAAIPGNIFGEIMSGSVTLESADRWAKSVYETVVSNNTVLAMWDKFVTSNAFISANFTLILLAGALFIAFFGRRYAYPIKVFTSFVVTFCLCAAYVSPILDAFFEIPHWIVPLVAASVSAVLCRIIYLVFVGAAIVGACYFVVMGPAASIPFIGGNQAAAIGVAIAAVLLFFFFRKHAERICFALLGGFLAALVLRRFYDYTTFLPTLGKWLILVVTIAVAIPGFIYQHKHRRKYFYY